MPVFFPTNPTNELTPAYMTNGTMNISERRGQLYIARVYMSDYNQIVRLVDNWQNDLQEFQRRMMQTAGRHDINNVELGYLNRYNAGIPLVLAFDDAKENGVLF